MLIKTRLFNALYYVIVLVLGREIGEVSKRFRKSSRLALRKSFHLRATKQNKECIKRNKSMPSITPLEKNKEGKFETEGV